MKAIEEITAELYARGDRAESHALTLIRCVDYDHELGDDTARYAATRTILDAMDRARARLLEESRARLEAWQAERLAERLGRYLPEGAAEQIRSGITAAAAREMEDHAEE